MTELTQPLAASPAETRTARKRGARRGGATFAELVYAHFAWWHSVHEGKRSEPSTTAYHKALADFERRHGEIVSAYWCSHVESAVALTHHRRRFRWIAPVAEFHRESDWATQNAPDIACELHRCDELAVRARTVLTGVRRLICMQLVMASAAHLLSLVDARASHSDADKTAEALRRESAALDRTQEYYREAANGQAQIIYFIGMATVALAIGVCCAVWLGIEWASPLAALGAGSFGAVVSVIQRINAGKFSLEYDVGRPYALFLGGLRPLIGGAFAVVLSFAFTGGLVHLPIEPSADRKLALLVVAFVAGFSERWAQDTLAAALPVAGAEKAPSKPA